MDINQLIEAGRIVNTHGVAGEVKIEVWVDSPRFLKACRRIFIGSGEYPFVSAREHKGMLIAKLGGVEDVNAAMTLKGKDVFIRRGDAALPRGAFFLQDIIGAAVIDEKRGEIGTLTEILETPANRVYIVKGETEHLIPVVPEFIMSTDAENKIVRVRLIEGM